MGEHHVELESDPEQRRAFIRRLLDDLRALEKMAAGKMRPVVGEWK